MKNNSSYSSAFTVFEAAVTLVISAIIILVVYQLVVTVQMQFTKYRQYQDETIVYEQFEAQLQKDIVLASSFNYSQGHGLHLEVLGTEVVYAFAKAHTIRSSQRIDTFAIGFTDVQHSIQETSSSKKHVLRGSSRLLEADVHFFQSKTVDRSSLVNAYFKK